jgi:two-component system nitrogen regulation sensor histidine kinase GlnL
MSLPPEFTVLTGPRGVDADRLLETLPAAIVVVDAAGRIRMVNAAAAEALADAQGLMGRRLGDVVGADSPLLELVRRAQAELHRSAQATITMQVGPARGSRYAVAAAPSSGEDGLISLVLTPLPRLRTPLSPSTATRALAHEVRNPLAGIRAAAQLISRSGEEDVATLANLICDEVDRIRRLTDRIDPFAAATAPTFQRLNIHEALDRVRRIVSSTAPTVRIVERYDPSLPHVYGDLDQLIQAFLNMAKNAVEAVEDTPDPQVRFLTAFRPGVRMRRAAEGAGRPLMEICIEDNGPGLPAAVAEKLFEPFVTTKSGGMGLGLTISADVIARHDGSIEVESAPGRTLFRVLLPCGGEKTGE